MALWSPWRRYRIFLGGAAAGVAVACASLHRGQRAAPTPDDAVSVQIMRREPSLAGVSFRVLLDFEIEEDLGAVETEPAGAARIGGPPSHSGQHALALAPGSRKLSVKLSALPACTVFPGSWTLAGAYFYGESRTKVTVAYQSGGAVMAKATTELAAGQWTGVFVDVSGLADPNRPPPPVGTLVFTMDGTGPVWCDDVMVINTLPRGPGGGGGSAELPERPIITDGRGQSALAAINSLDRGDDDQTRSGSAGRRGCRWSWEWRLACNRRAMRLGPGSFGAPGIGAF